MVDRRVVEPALVQVVQGPGLIARARIGDRVEHAGVDVQRAHLRPADRRRRRARRQGQVRGDHDRVPEVGRPVRRRAVEDDVDIVDVTGDQADARIVEVRDADVVADRAADQHARR
jgi:hypothetical protein